MKKTCQFLLPLVSLLFCVSCVDNTYDLSDINTNSRFYVNGLTVPMNMDPVKLDLMLDLSDDSDIKKDSEGNYYIKKDGSFTSDPIKVEKMVLTKPDVEFNGKIALRVSLPSDIKRKFQMYAGNITVGQLLENDALMSQIGITKDTEILSLSFDSSTSPSEINLRANYVDTNVKRIETIGFDPTTMAIMVKINGIQNVLKPFGISDLRLEMPKGLIATTKLGTTYNPTAGTLTPDNGNFVLDANYVADLSLTVRGIDYNLLEEDGMKVFDPETHTFMYKKSCAAKGNATLRFSDLLPSAKYNDIVALEQENASSYECEIGFSKGLVVSSFMGDITYNLNDIDLAPVSVSSIPDMLKENGTNIDLTNPQIYYNINNHLSQYGIMVNSDIEIKGNNVITAPFTIENTEVTKLVMAPLKDNLYHKDGYTFEEVKSLSKVVGSNVGETFPEQLNVRVIKPRVPYTILSKPLEMGKELSGVEGTWEFYTRLSLTDKTKIKYTKSWDSWGDGDLDGLTITKATVNVTLQKDLGLDAENIEFVLYGNKGELRGQTALTGDEAQNITIELNGDPVSEIQGGKLNVHLKGLNKDLNKDQEIKINNLKVTLNGYYDCKL